LRHQHCQLAGIFGSVAIRCDWGSTCLALYGVAPFAGQVGMDLGLHPVMTLVSTVIATRVVAQGETVGYGVFGRRSAIQLLPSWQAGYGDGLPRGLPSNTPY